MAVRTVKRIGNNRAFICLRENNKLVLRPVKILGSVRVVAGKEAAEDKTAKWIYDLRQQIHDGTIQVELLNGGAWNNELSGYKNWFPGSKTYGFVRYQDAPIVDVNGHQIYDEHDNALYVPMYGGPVTVEDALVEILDILDDAMIDQDLKTRWNIYYHIKTASGVVGYISALAVTDIIYRV